ncbi:MAG: PfkB family carbohydrate kinase [Thermomicrobiales bacterium]
MQREGVSTATVSFSTTCRQGWPTHPDRTRRRESDRSCAGRNLGSYGAGHPRQSTGGNRTRSWPRSNTGEILESVWQTAATLSIPVICNATPEPRDGRSLALSASMLIVNEGESMELLDIREAPDDWMAVAAALQREGPTCVVITLGSKGAVVVDGDERALIPARPVEAVDTTGAGDAFCGSFAAEIARGSNALAAARVGVVAGSIAVTRPGAQPSMPMRDEIEAILRER